MIFSMMIAAGEFQHPAIGLSLALAPAIAGFRTIAPVPTRMEQHGDSYDRHFVRGGQEREHLPLDPQAEPWVTTFFAATVSQHLPCIREFVTYVEEAPALARKMLPRRF